MISDKQRQIMLFPYLNYESLICDGAIRSGKTVFMMLSFVDWAMREFNHQRFGICGKTVGSAEQNIIKPYIVLKYVKQRYNVRWRRSEKILVIKRGNKENIFEVFGGKDESSYMLIQGRTLAGVLLDEVALMPKSFVEQALARCSVEGSKFFFNCNPESPQHWFYLEWINEAEKHNAMHLHFQLEDNPSLSQKKINSYKSQYTGVFYQRYILGEWVLAEGLVYDFGEDNITDDIPENGEYWISIDYGTLNPFSAGLWCIVGDKATRIAEYYYNGREKQIQRTDEQYCDDVENLVKKLKGKKLHGIICDPSAASFITAMRRRGYTVRGANNDVLDGIRLTASLLKSGNIKIHKSCVNCIAEFGLYRWDEKANEDKVIKENDHCLTGDTIVHTLRGKKRIKDMIGKCGLVWSYNGKRKVLRPYFGVRKTGENKTVYKIVLIDGREICCTAEHKVLTNHEWMTAESVMRWKQQWKRLGIELYIYDAIENEYIEVFDIRLRRNREDVYNMEVMGTHCFAVNGGLIVHNCMDDVRYFCSTVMKNKIHQNNNKPFWMR